MWAIGWTVEFVAEAAATILAASEAAESAAAAWCAEADEAEAV